MFFYCSVILDFIKASYELNISKLQTAMVK